MSSRNDGVRGIHLMRWFVAFVCAGSLPSVRQAGQGSPSAHSRSTYDRTLARLA